MKRSNALVGQSEKGISRRKFLALGAAVLGSAALAGYAVKQGVHGQIKDNVLDYLDSKLMPEEELNIVRVDGNLYTNVGGSLMKFKHPVTYVEFRNNIFVLYPEQAKPGDGPIKMIRRAYNKHDPNDRLDEDIVLRLEDLFNIIVNKKKDIGSIVKNETKSIKAKVPPTPLIKAGETYLVPIKTAYQNLDQALSAYK